MNQQLRYHGGTLVLENTPPGAVLPAPFRWVKGKPRCPAHHYSSLIPWLKAQGVRDTVPRWKHLDLELHDPREPHDYQREALAAWLAAEGRGSVVLPTGAGKTLLAIHAIARLAREINRLANSVMTPEFTCRFIVILLSERQQNTPTSDKVPPSDDLLYLTVNFGAQFHVKREFAHENMRETSGKSQSRPMCPGCMISEVLT